jgi:5'-nucleotidase
MRPLSRRQFITRSLGSGAAVVLGPTFQFDVLGRMRDVSTRARAAAETTITILHTNDTHSRLEPFPADDPRNAGLGGAARRATLVKKIRQENPNTLLVDSGDAFQGTPFYNVYRGEVEYRVMSAIGYDVVGLGNHEFDSGLESLARAVNFAKFDIVCSNYDFRETLLRDRIKPYVVKEVGGIKVGVFGLGIAFDGLVLESNRKGVRYLDPLQTARAMIRVLRYQEDATLVICLSHLGLLNRREGEASNQRREFGDRELAEQVEGIDAIIGGHTHTFMKEPEIVKRPGSGSTLIFQVGFGGINVGRLDFTIKDNKVLGASGRLVPIQNV